MKRLRFVSAIVCASVTWPTSAHADAVTYWNAVTVNAVSTGRPGGAGFLDMALVHAAMHDAIQAIQQRFEPHAARLEGTGSPDAAAGAAAYGVLVGLYPTQQAVFDQRYKEFLATAGLAGNPGLAVGQQAAAVLLKQHRPSTALPDFRGGSTPGAWRPTPSLIGSPPQPAAFSPMAALYLMETRPYVMERPSQFRPEAPPALTSAAYLLPVERRAPVDRGRPQAGGRRQRPSVCARQPCRGRCGDCLLGQQAALQLLASGHGDPGSRERRQPGNGR